MAKTMTRQTSHPRPRRLPAGKQLEATIQGMLTRPRVNACFVGRKYVGGRITKRLALVCGVDQKVAEDELDSHELLPSVVQLDLLSRRRSRIATDVIETPSLLDLESTVLGPADVANPDRPPYRATVGIALRHPIFGDVVTTAGHAIPPGLGDGDRILVESGGSSFSARIRSVTVNQLSDHALLQPEDVPVLGNFFQDITPLGPPYVSDPQADIDTRLFVLFSDGTTRAVSCRGLQASVPIASNIFMHNMILTEWVTQGGDSGTCLVDRNWRVWGLLLGSYRATHLGQDFSVFIPAFRVLSLENARFL